AEAGLELPSDVWGGLPSLPQQRLFLSRRELSHARARGQNGLGARLHGIRGTPACCCLDGAHVGLAHGSSLRRENRIGLLLSTATENAHAWLLSSRKRVILRLYGVMVGSVMSRWFLRHRLGKGQRQSIALVR